MSEAEIQSCIDAFAKAIETIHALHGDVAWDIYNKNAPEMKAIYSAVRLLQETRKSLLIDKLPLW